MSALSLTFVIANPSTSIDLPISGNWPDYSINWGDGTTNTSTKNHTYNNAGTYTAVLTVTSGVTRFGSNGAWTGSDKLAVVSTNDVTTWGLGSQLNNLKGAFYGASNLTTVPVNIPTTVNNCKDMFNRASVFNQNIGGWNTGNVTNMSQMFRQCSDFNQDISSWDTSKVNDMEYMFEGASAFNQDMNTNGNSWNTGIVTRMNYMFKGTTAFNGNISSWDTSKVEAMYSMFDGASNFNQDISSWDTSSVTNINRMFQSATAFNQNIRVWDTSSVTNYNNMFNSALAMITTYGPAGQNLASFGTANNYTPTSAFFNYVPPSATCFPAGTPIQTDQGVTAIEQLVPGEHTLRGKSILAITETRSLQKHIVCFEKDSIGKNVPFQQTLCSKEHKVLYRGEMIKARDLADMCKNVKKVSYNGETLYNVLLEKHGKMLVNNMICETLHPENISAKFAKSKSSPSKRILA